MPAIRTLHLVPDPGEIVEMVDNGVRLAPVELMPMPVLDDSPPIDTVAREAEIKVDALEQVVQHGEAILDYLVGFLGESPRGRAAINSAGIKLGEVREQLPVLRQDVRDMERGS